MERTIIPRGRTSADDWRIVNVAHAPLDDGPQALARAVLAAAKLHKLVLGVWLVACIGLALLYAHLTPPVYTAVATLLLEPRRSTPAAGQDVTAALLLDSNRAESELQVIRSERLLAKVFDSQALAQEPEFANPVLDPIGRLVGLIKAIPGLGSAGEVHSADARQIAFSTFTDRVAVRRVGQSYVVEVSYVSADPSRARRIANGIVSAYLWQSILLKADAARNGAEFMQGRIDGLATQVAAADTAIVQGTLPASPTPDADARVIGAALQPLRRSAPRTGLIVALGGVFGLLGGALTVMFLVASDHRIRTSDDLTRVRGLACLATIPDVNLRAARFKQFRDDIGRMASLWPMTAFAAGVRDLRTSIMLAMPPETRNRNAVVALVSWRPGSGCSLLCGSLANVIRDSGQRITLIDADIHRQAQRPTEMPQQALSLADAIASGAPLDASSFLNLDGIDVLPGPSLDHRVNELAYLGAPVLSRIVDDARHRGLVILDLPPLRDEGDARAAASLADAVVLVVVVDQTTTDEVTAALQALSTAGANVIGVALNRARPRRGATT